MFESMYLYNCASMPELLIELLGCWLGFTMVHLESRLHTSMTKAGVPLHQVIMPLVV